jgi:hypothetical protein
MGADAEAGASTLTARTIEPTIRSRLFGLGSIYGKTLRDSRGAVLLVGFAAGLFMLATATPYGTEFTTAASRAQLVAQMSSLPAVFRGLLGEPINIETLGGFLSWRVGNILPVLLGLWPVLALSGTLAGERCVDPRENSIIAVRPETRAISPASRMQSGVAAKSSTVTRRFVSDGE